MTSVGCGRGTMIPRWLGLGEDVGDVEHVLGLEAEVELLDDRLREQLHQRRRVGERGDGDAADEAGREPRERGDVVAEELRDPRALHLDDDLLAGDEAGRVHLRDRRRRDRLLVELGEELLERAAEVDLDDGPDVLERLGRHLVAQLLELGDQLVGEEALAARDDLAELHVARAERARTHCASGGRSRRATRPPVLEEQPARDARPIAVDGADEAHRRGGSRPGASSRGTSWRVPRTQALDLPAPGDLVGIEDPGPAIAERAELEIRRAVGERRPGRSCHPPSYRPVT